MNSVVQEISDENISEFGKLQNITEINDMSDEVRKIYGSKLLATTTINGQEKNFFPAACAVAALGMSMEEITSPSKESKFKGDYFCFFFILVNLASKCIGQFSSGRKHRYVF